MPHNWMERTEISCASCAVLEQTMFLLENRSRIHNSHQHSFTRLRVYSHAVLWDYTQAQHYFELMNLELLNQSIEQVTFYTWWLCYIRWIDWSSWHLEHVTRITLVFTLLFRSVLVIGYEMVCIQATTSVYDCLLAEMHPLFLDKAIED